MTKYAKYVGICALALAVGLGCATAAKGPSDQEQIQSVLNKWGQSLVAKDVNALMALYSENFQAQGRGKADMKEFIEDAIDEGYLEDAKVDTSAVQIAIEGDTATATPITLEGPAGSMSLRLDLSKENGQWLIVGTGEA